MEHKESSVDKFEKFTWKIDNFSGLTNHVYYEHFILDGYPWTICLYPKWRDQIRITLKAKQTANMSEGWNRYVKFKFFIFNQLDTNMTVTSLERDRKFNTVNDEWGFRSSKPLTELCDPKAGFIVKDACIVGVEVFVYKSTLEKQVKRTEHMELEVPMPNPEVEGYEKDSTKDPDAELVYAALGRVIYFLKTRKLKDMNDQACKELQVLWDQLQKFQFDVTWLEPHVQSALGMKGYVERVMEVEKLKEDVVVSKLETEKLEVKLVAAEFNLDVERDLLKAKGFKEEIDLDSELGCGSWKPKKKPKLNLD